RRGCDREFVSGKIIERTGIGGRPGIGAKPSRMASARHSGDADVYSSQRRDWTRIRERRFTTGFAEALSMVSGIALASRALHRHRPATRTYSLAGRRLRQGSCKPGYYFERAEVDR